MNQRYRQRGIGGGTSATNTTRQRQGHGQPTAFPAPPMATSPYDRNVPGRGPYQCKPRQRPRPPAGHPPRGPTAAPAAAAASVEVARSRSTAAASTGIELDEDAEDFKYAVQTRFSRPGKLGLEFEEDRDSGQIVVQHVTQGGTAEGLPHVCAGLILTHVAAGRKAETSVSSLSFDDVMDLLGERPLALTFEHPWQKEMDEVSGDAFYFNSHTETSEWDKPPELEGVVASMREWKGKGPRGLSVSAPAASIAAPVPAPAPATAAATARADAAAPATAAVAAAGARVASSRLAAASSTDTELDEDAEGFRYEVQLRFSRPGKLGLEFEHQRDSGHIVVQHVTTGSTAGGLPHVCAGLILTHVAAGRRHTALVVTSLP